MRLQHQWWSGLVAAVLGGLVGVTTVAAGEQFLPMLGYREGALRFLGIPRANGYIAYFPTIRDAVMGGYGANNVTTRVEIGAGERMVDRGLIHIYRILGMLKDKPEQP